MSGGLHVPPGAAVSLKVHNHVHRPVTLSTPENPGACVASLRLAYAWLRNDIFLGLHVPPFWVQQFYFTSARQRASSGTMVQYACEGGRQRGER